MAFYKKSQQKVNGLWYPLSVTVGKPVSTDEVADRLAQISTVSRADTYAVLKDLAGVLADYMAGGDGRGGGRLADYWRAGTLYSGIPSQR